MLEFLNISFLAFHSLWMLFNCVGWIWKRTRPWHLATLTLTACSWFGLGIWYGWGYCLCTDWHWQVRDRLGYHHDNSYTHLLILEVSGLDVSPWQADALTGFVFAIASLLSLILNGRDLLKKRAARSCS